MKFLSLGFVLVALLFVEHDVHAVVTTAKPTTANPTTPKPAKKSCPQPSEVNSECLCYEALKTMICSNVSKPFKLNDDYELTTLVFKEITKFPLVIEDFHKSSNKLTVESLVILHKEGPLSLPSMDDLEALFAISTESIKIMSSGETEDILDVSELSADLTSIVIENVKALKGFDFNKFSLLSHLVLRDITFTDTVPPALYENTNLKYVEISNVNGFTGLANFKPEVCDAKERIQIKLRNNANMKLFDFTRLFAHDDCYFHIDLSDNPNLDPELLNRQIVGLKEDLKKPEEQKSEKITKWAEHFFLIMRDSPVNCNCDLRKLYKVYQPSLHSIVCKKESKPLAVLSVDRCTQ